ncbi:MAG: DUF3108 domain-containing protein [Burkholderiales bacterium]|nr:DUF3108 domain-containing protein [Rhodocyclaceae bacterium]MCA3022726.1 DUF3108 domain-containing protein [Rhodocyclaceae bacterium]MCA3051505.1 DUF3108 domain-containing protein [Rhodocyclaceae bacterium]
MPQFNFRYSLNRRLSNPLGLGGYAPLLCVAAFLIVGPALPAKAGSTLPNSVKTTYKIYRGGVLLGNVEERFERDGDRYKITSTTRTDGPISLLIREEISVTSEGRITASRLAPSVFSVSRKSDSSKSFTAYFSWEKSELVREHDRPDFEGGVEREVFALPAGTQDRLSEMYQFKVATPSGPTVSALMTQGKHTERYRYAKRGEPSIATQAGLFATVYYVREAAPGESKAELWLAKEHNYIPVRVVAKDPKGSSFEQHLVELVIG